MRETGSRCQLKRAHRPGGWAPGLAALLHYDPAWLTKDVAAALSVAVIGLPVGIAHAELTGVPASIGIYAAIFWCPMPCSAPRAS